jgi:hypothetical protein
VDAGTSSTVPMAVLSALAEPPLQAACLVFKQMSWLLMLLMLWMFRVLLPS